MRTLIYHSGALGDFITSLPLISQINGSHYGPVTLLGNPNNISLASASHHIGGGIDCNSALVGSFFRDRPDHPALARFLQPYRLILLFTVPQSPLAKNFRDCTTVPIIVHPPFPEKHIHITEYHLELLNRLALPAPPAIKAVPFIPVSSDPEAQITPPPKPDSLIIHPGSGSRLKNWPFERFLTVADTFRKQGIPISWLTGPAEYHVTIPSQDSRYYDLSLPQCCHLLKNGAVFLGNDSGIAHLAAAITIPSVVLFGPSNPAIWAPRGRNRITILHHPTACAPCHPGRILRDHCLKKCFDALSVEEVISAIEQLLKKNNS